MSDGMASAPPGEGPLAIICGAGSLPFAVADSARRQGRSIVLFALRGWADPGRVASYPHRWVRFGQLGAFAAPPDKKAAVMWFLSDRSFDRRSGKSGRIWRHCA